MVHYERRPARCVTAIGKVLLYLLVVSAVTLLFVAQHSSAAPPDRTAVVGGLCGNAEAAGKTAAQLLAATATAPLGDLEFADTAVNALMTKRLLCPAQDGGTAVMVETDHTGTAGAGRTIDAVTGVPAAPAAGAKAPFVSLKNRATFTSLAAALTVLVGNDRSARLKALDALSRNPGIVPDGYFERASKSAGDPVVASRIEDIVQLAALTSPDIQKRIPAVARLAETANGRTLSKLEALKADPAYAANPAYAKAVDGAIAKVRTAVDTGTTLATIYNGLSLASILFMASIGLAIIFGLMGVINLAQGEFIMIGAYVTYCVQEVLHKALPGLIDWYLIIAIPFAFLVTAAIGVALEIALIRHLYRRPLMSLLATWAVSLALSNLVRVLFGTQNLQMEVPFYVTGGLHVIGDFIMTWNRLFAIGFASITLAGTWLLIRRTGLGLDIRAVSQNRDMAGCIGIATRRVDMFAFGLGSGLAGLAGLALSPIYNVNPDMGSSFIIDSFMVVVLGGVGSIVGTVIAALGIGQINVLIEPFWGAVAAKVIVLGLIIVFLQWRPEGLFAIAGRRK